MLLIYSSAPLALRPENMNWKDSIASAFAPLANIASYHLLLYSTLLGTELYQVNPSGQSEIAFGAYRILDNGRASS